jgi:hypothetical protein
MGKAADGGLWMKKTIDICQDFADDAGELEAVAGV